MSRKRLMILFVTSCFSLFSIPVSAFSLTGNAVSRNSDETNDFSEYNTFKNLAEKALNKYRTCCDDFLFKLPNNLIQSSVTISDSQKLIENIGNAASDYVANTVAASMSYWEVLYGGPEEAPFNATYHNLIEVMGVAYDTDLEEIETNTKDLKKNIQLILKDGVITEEEFQLIKDYIQKYDEIINRQTIPSSDSEEQDDSAVENQTAFTSDDDIDLLVQNMTDFDKKVLQNAVDCALYNLQNDLEIKSFSSYISQKLETTSISRLKRIKESLGNNGQKSDCFEISANYTDWFNHFSPDKIEYDPHFSSSYGLDVRALSIDELQIFLDSKTNDIQFIMLPLIASDNGEATRQAYSVIALISAIEYGALPQSESDMEYVGNISSIISYNLINCLTDNSDKIISDNRMTIYEDDDYVYQIIYLSESSKFELVVFETDN